MKLLYIFLDGVGLGNDDPEVNPFAKVRMAALERLLGGRKMIANGHVPSGVNQGYLADTESATLLPLDACLGVEGIPQSATGQASLFTGINVPATLGFHEGPKPTPAIINIIKNGTLISVLQERGKTAALVNAFPDRYFENIETGYRIPGVIAMSIQQAGFQLKTAHDLMDGNAISVDFTAEGWRSHLGFPETSLLSRDEAGKRLATLSEKTDLSIFENWLTDVAGHHQDMQSACTLLETLDEVISSVISHWDFDAGLILLTSDHGNIEDLSTRRHTRNEVPLLIIGSRKLRESFLHSMAYVQPTNANHDLTNITPAILEFLSQF